ncbi:MAG: transposase [Armatimonadota bacterium]
MSHRTFTPEFKRKVVEDHLHGGRTIAEICREYQLSR